MTKPIALILDLKDISGSGYGGMPGDADLLWVPASRLVEIYEYMPPAKKLMQQHKLSEFRQIDWEVTFFDASKIPDDRDDLVDAQQAAYDGCGLVYNDWEPEEARNIQLKEIKFLDGCFLWTCVIGDDGPGCLESRELSWADLHKIVTEEFAKVG
jgi:hypothetical protein